MSGDLIKLRAAYQPRVQRKGRICPEFERPVYRDEEAKLPFTCVICSKTKDLYKDNRGIVGAGDWQGDFPNAFNTRCCMACMHFNSWNSPFGTTRPDHFNIARLFAVSETLRREAQHGAVEQGQN